MAITFGAGGAAGRAAGGAERNAGRDVEDADLEHVARLRSLDGDRAHEEMSAGYPGDADGFLADPDRLLERGALRDRQIDVVLFQKLVGQGHGIFAGGGAGPARAAAAVDPDDGAGGHGDDGFLRDGKRAEDGILRRERDVEVISDLHGRGRQREEHAGGDQGEGLRDRNAATLVEAGDGGRGDRCGGHVAGARG